MSSDIGEMKRLVVIRQRLMDAGVTVLRCHYSGSGDSGQMDGMSCTLTETNQVTGSAITGDLDFEDLPIIGKDTELIRELEELFWDKIEAHGHGGWENNDGGEGEFVWTLATDHLEYTHHDFYLERHTERHEGW